MLLYFWTDMWWTAWFPNLKASRFVYKYKMVFNTFGVTSRKKKYIAFTIANYFQKEIHPPSNPSNR